MSTYLESRHFVHVVKCETASTFTGTHHLPPQLVVATEPLNLDQFFTQLDMPPCVVDTEAQTTNDTAL